MSKPIITTQQRLANFSAKFDAAIQDKAIFPTLNSEGKENIKHEYLKTIKNFSERVTLGNSLMGGESYFRDPYELIGEKVSDVLDLVGKPQNFSNNLGGVESQNISNLILQAQYQSYGLGYIFNMYGMDHPKTLFNFQSLKAENSFGIFKENATLIDQRSSSHPMAQLTGTAINEFEKEVSATQIDASTEFNFPIRIKSITLEGYDDVSKKWVLMGYDVQSNNHTGMLAQKVSVADKVDINYDTGTITATTPKAVTGISKFRWKVWKDLTKQPDGQAPTVYAANDHIELESKPHFFSIRQNLEDIVRMNKEYQINKPNGIASSYAKTAISQLMSLYIKGVDVDIMNTLVTPFIPTILANTPATTFNLSNWQNSGNTNLLETRMAQMFSTIEAYMSGIADGRRPTSIITDSNGAVALMSNRYFQKAGAGFAYSDGLVGTLYGINIIRSRYLDYLFSPTWKKDGGEDNPYNLSDALSNAVSPDNNEQISVMFAVHKDMANRTAPGVLGSYIPPYATNGMLDRGGMNIVHTIETEYTSALVLPQLVAPFVVRTSGSLNYKGHDVVVR